VTEWNDWRNQGHELPPDLAQSDFRGLVLKGANLYRANLAGSTFQHCDLSRAKFSEANIGNANFSEAVLSNADFRKADLTAALFHRAQLNGAKFNSASLALTDFRFANLSQTDLRGAYLLDANLQGSVLKGARVGGATVSGVVFGDLDLSTVKGLDDLRYRGPSNLDIQTLLKSGTLPLAFLRGCGLPDHFITYLPSLATQPFEFYSCFISYSSKDQSFATRLFADLQNRGIRCYYAPHHLRGGVKLHDQIDQAIRVHDRLLVILSDDSMRSEWVTTEIAKARQRELREHRQVLFPIALVPFERIREWNCFDADIGKDTAREIREYYIPDFTGWKDHDLYQRSFERLVADLRPSSPA
jgi:hypothetical protein